MPTPAAPPPLETHRRGRPSKYGRPSQVVAVTLPRSTVQRLSKLHSDLGWAIVSVVETHHQAQAEDEPPDVALVEVGDRQFLIVVHAAVFRGVPGVQLVPLSKTQAFLALDPGRTMADLEVFVRDRLEQLTRPSREQRALATLGRELRKWRRDPAIQPESRAIIILTKTPNRRTSVSRETSARRRPGPA
jgi:hypothetical protein